jgi:hypothetical protein
VARVQTFGVYSFLPPTESPAAILVDEAKSIRDEILDALERCHTSYRLFMSSTGSAFGGFYQLCTAKAHLWKTFRIPSSLCPHVEPATIEADRENLKDSVFRIKHGAEWRALSERPTAFCDFAGSGDESVLALCDGNRAEIVDAWRSQATMHSVGKFLTLFRRLDLQGHQVGGDEGYGHQLMDCMQEERFYLQRFNNGSPVKRSDIYANLSANDGQRSANGSNAGRSSSRMMKSSLLS